VEALLTELGATREEIATARARGTFSELALRKALRVSVPDLTLAEIASASGADEATLGRLWRALGFPSPEGDDVLLDGAAAEALTFLALIGREYLGQEATLGVARVVGASMARTVQALVDAFRVEFELPKLSSGLQYSDVLRGYAEVASAGVEGLLDVFGVVFRRHLLAEASAGWTFDDESAVSRRNIAVGFADLVGYTALSGMMSGGELVSLIGRFESCLDELTAPHGVRVVKLIGDGAMFVADDALSICEYGLELVERFAADATLPELRVGLSAGSVVSAHGDFYGDIVNLAARLLTAADPSTVVADEAVHSRVVETAGAGGGTAGETAGLGIEFVALGIRPLKGIAEPPPAYLVRRSRA
jgi:adenylate cyclase